MPSEQAYIAAQQAEGSVRGKFGPRYTSVCSDPDSMRKPSARSIGTSSEHPLLHDC